MRLEPFKVAFIGSATTRIKKVLADLSPAFQPLLCGTWAELYEQDPVFNPEVTVILPGETAHPEVKGHQITLTKTDCLQNTEWFETRILDPVGSNSGKTSRLLGRSPAMIRFRSDLEALAKTEHPLLLTGENGTGKDLAANEAHCLSNRRDKPFIAVNCGAIPLALAESELFGCVKGAFTGAENRTGFFRQASGGTLFLDEIGELPLEIQVKLLRVLENKEFRRIGADTSEHADFRLICATNRDLQADVRSKIFREDLFYRINVLCLKMPSLRERLEDLPILANHILEKDPIGTDKHPRVGKRAISKLAEYHWPGNLRQLRNVLVRAAVLHGEVELEPEHFDLEA